MTIEYSRTERPPLPSRRDRKKKLDQAEKATRKTTERAQRIQEAEEAKVAEKTHASDEALATDEVPVANTKPKKKFNWFSTLLLLIGLSLMAYALWELGQIWWKYYSADKAYSALSDKYTTPVSDNNGEGADDPMLQAARERIIDFEGLREVNPDIVGWIYIPDTRMDYPIVHTDNNTYYLKTSFERNYSDGGTIFLEMVNRPDFSDKDSRIYGHNMYDRSMFGQLPLYRKTEFADLHKHIFLYLPTETREYLHFEGGLITADGLLAVESDNPDEMFLTLVTCEYDFDDARYFIRALREYVYKPGGEKIWTFERTEPTE